MKKSELIKKLQAIPGDIDVCIYDWETNARDDIGDGSSVGIYSDFEVDVITLEKDEVDFVKEEYGRDFVPWIALGFKNESLENIDPINFLELDHPVKGKIKIPVRQYAISDEQQFSVMGIDFSEGIELGQHEGIQYNCLGKLEEQSVIFNAQIINSLENDAWDFENYPNPEIVLITQKINS